MYCIRETTLFLFTLMVTAYFCSGSSSTTESSTSSTTKGIQTSSRLCYGCADSTHKEGGNDCQVNTEEMMIESGHVLGLLATTDSKRRERLLSSIDYIQNCSSYGGNFTYCIIETTETQGTVFSYIRGCSDGNAYSTSIRNHHHFKGIRADNQSRFASNDQGYLFSVTLCDSNFCNGPKPHSDVSRTVSNFLLLSLLVLSSIVFTIFM